MRESNFLIGLLVGGVAAGLGALLVAPKSGKELIDDITETYGDLAEKTGDFTEEMKHKSWHLLHPGAACPTCNGNSATQFTVGAISGAILGASSALLLAPKPGQKLRKDIESTYHNIVDQGEDWKEHLGDFVHQIQKAMHPNKRGSKLNHILSLANMGLQVWENIQKRK